MQDHCGSTVYSVLRAPKEGGAVYTIAPKDDQSKIKHVHCTLLKAVVGTESPGCVVASNTSPPDSPVSESSCDGDFLFLVPKTAPLHTLPAARAAAETQTAPQLLHHRAPSTWHQGLQLLKVLYHTPSLHSLDPGVKHVCLVYRRDSDTKRGVDRSRMIAFPVALPVRGIVSFNFPAYKKEGS